MFFDKRCYCVLCRIYKKAEKLKYKYENIGVCESCYKKISTTRDKTFDGRGNISVVMSPFIYEGAMRKAIKQFKFSRQMLFGKLFGEMLYDELKMHKWIFDYDYIIPVPLHRERLLERGYNQSEIIAEILSEKINVPMANDVLFRIRNTERQSGLAGRKRIENVKGAFAVFDGLVKGKRILLLDDIYTMGATAGACADCLKQAGAAEVAVITFSITIN